MHRTHCETRYAAKSWKTPRRAIARIEATTLGMDIRTIVTSLKGSTPERLYEFTYCDRGQAENLIKLHKTQLKSDRTSCTSAAANQFRLILHTAAYWLLWALRDAMPQGAVLKTAEFTTLQHRRDYFRVCRPAIPEPSTAQPSKIAPRFGAGNSYARTCEQSRADGPTPVRNRAS